ncbi:MAG TPA: SEC-C metal-binding domain-containing protein [Bryobacteraceae bacterium]|nr:SEC-C metal-binding domain-containing protein [Bryobacteraceae bacterium]
MATPTQIEASRRNANASTGPRTEEGKARSSRNALKFGLFSAKNCIQPGEEEDYATLSNALWDELDPRGPIQQLLATEIVRAAWRLERCAKVEAALGEAMQLGNADNEPLDPMADPANAGRTQSAVDRARQQATAAFNRNLVQLNRLKAERSSPAPEPAKPATAASAPVPVATANRTRTPATDCPRNAPCPCGSREKYKRCCGRNAPPVLSRAA